MANNDHEPIKGDNQPSKPAGTNPEPKPLEPPKQRGKRTRTGTGTRTGTRTGKGTGTGTTNIDKTSTIETETKPESVVSGIGIKSDKTGKQPPPPDFLVDATEEALKEQAEAALSGAIVLLAIVDGLAVMAWGNAARMNDTERGMITPPLERILSRLGPGINNYVSAWGDPIMLIMGLIAWGSRISRINRKPEPEPEPKPEPEPINVNQPINKDNHTGDIGAATSAPDNIFNGFFGETS